MIETIEIAFKDGITASEDVKSFISEKAESLGKKYSELSSVRVFVSVPHRAKERGNEYDVNIDMRYGGEEIAASKDHTEGLTEIHGAISDSFRRAERLLKDKSEQKKSHRS